MNALVVYDSKFGNTRRIAETISDPRKPLKPHVIWWPFLAPPSATRPATLPSK